jgi:hypothetical protein
MHSAQSQPDEMQYCSNGDLVVGESGWWSDARSLLAFDTGTIPANAVVSSAILRVRSRSPVRLTPAETTAPHAISVHHVTSLWDAHGVNWVYRRHDGIGGPLTPWATPGGDFEADPVSTASVPAHTQNAPGEWQVRRSVQRWVSQSSSNQGLLLRSAAASGGIELCAHPVHCTDSSKRPRLEVTYLFDTTPPGPIHLDGTLYDDRDTQLLPDEHDLAFAVDDLNGVNAGSGIDRVEVRVDGQVAHTAYPDSGCVAGECDVDDSQWVLDARAYSGNHTIEVKAYDRVGLSTSVSWSSNFDGVALPYVHTPPGGVGESNGGGALGIARWSMGCPKSTRDAARGLTRPGVLRAVRTGRWRDGARREGIETTEVYTGGSYLVTRCTDSGRFVLGQMVGPVAVPGGVALLPVEITAPTRLGDLLSSVPEYRRPEDPVFVSLWRHNRHDILRSTLPKTKVIP